MAVVPRLRSAFDGTQPPSVAALYTAVCAWAVARLLAADWVVQGQGTADDQSYLAALTWLGLDWDEGPDVGGRGSPSNRAAQAAVQQLLDDRRAVSDPPGVVRLRLPTPGVTTLSSAPQGALTFDNAELPAPVLMTADGRPDALLAALVADRKTAATHRVAVGTPAALVAAAQAAAIAAALEWPPVVWVWLPPLTESVATQPFAALQAAGYLPSALFSHFLLCAWPAPGDRVLIDKWTARTQLTLDALHTDAADWDAERLDRLNRAAMAQLSDAQLANYLRDYLEEAYGDLPHSTSWLEDLTNAVRPALTRLTDVEQAAAWALDEPRLAAPAQAQLVQPAARALLVQLLAELTAVVLLDRATAAALVNGLVARYGAEAVPMIASALTGQIEGPPLDQVLALLGKARAQQRVAAHLRRLA